MEFLVGLVTGGILVIAVLFIRTYGEYTKEIEADKARSCGEIVGDKSICECRHVGLDCRYDEYRRQELKTSLNESKGE